MASDGKVTVRAAQLEDAAAAGRLAFRLLSEIDTARYGPDDYAETVRKHLGAESGFFMFLAFLDASPDTEPVGMITVAETVALYTCGRYAEIQELYVDPAQRSLGIGEQLIQAVEELGQGRGWERLQLHVTRTRDGDRSYDFYRRNGFEESGTTMRYRLTAAAG